MRQGTSPTSQMKVRTDGTRTPLRDSWEGGAPLTDFPRVEVETQRVEGFIPILHRLLNFSLTRDSLEEPKNKTTITFECYTLPCEWGAFFFI